VLLILLLLSCGLLHTATTQAESAQVKYVIDGDTLVLSDKRHVRLLAINTPEIEGKRQAEPGGQAAKDWLKTRLEGKQVFLETDQQKFDSYGRSLFYVFDSQGRLMNEQLLARGLAMLSIYPPNLKYVSRLQQAQRRAEVQGLGIWSLSAYRPQQLAQLMRSENKGWQRVIAAPLAIRQSGKYVRLILSPTTDIRIAKHSLRYFPALNNYLHCEIEVRGWVSWRKGQASILVRHPSALIIKDSNQCAEAL
jgi:endonuclease YncB( thermonuclease family)